MLSFGNYKLCIGILYLIACAVIFMSTEVSCLDVLDFSHIISVLE